MMPLKITTTRRGAEAMGAKEQRDCLRVSMGVIAVFWHLYFKALKFRDSATRRYNLLPRRGEAGSGRAFKGSYTWAKLKKRQNGEGARAIGETKPFVWSGRSRVRAILSRQVTATAKSSTKGTSAAIVNAPALNFRPKGGRINLREEFERVIDVETQELEGVGVEEYSEQVRKVKKTRTHVSQ